MRLFAAAARADAAMVTAAATTNDNASIGPDANVLATPSSPRTALYIGQDVQSSAPIAFVSIPHVVEAGDRHAELPSAHEDVRRQHERPQSLVASEHRRQPLRRVRARLLLTRDRLADRRRFGGASRSRLRAAGASHGDRDIISVRSTERRERNASHRWSFCARHCGQSYLVRDLIVTACRG